MVKKAKKDEANRFEWPFGPKNYLIFAIGILVIVVGYISLWAGSITLAPILLVLGYCVLIPVSIIVNGKKTVPPVENAEAKG
ncbi:MAG: hypothetical protein CVT49_14460 [candidate division Zixibacteria bacterium HGW-Zixibacteria-1]|nr:MAG: hypothetical protein CVT49_14460 [candidate division Zixibacteria bacterium HGW-Zixibacteria-1]